MSIQLHEKSREFTKTIFSRYQTVPLDDVVLDGTFVLHLYPTKDTLNTNGKAEGYFDSLFFRLDIYDVENNVKYSIKNRDEVVVLDDLKPHIRIFKDGSTVIFSREKVRLLLNKMVTMEKLILGEENV